MVASTSSAPAICGTLLGFTKLAASTRETPAAASLSHSLDRISGETIFSSFCKPSRGLRSTRCTRIGSPPSAPCFVAPTLPLFHLCEHGPAGDQVALAIGQRSDPTGVRGHYRLLHLHGLEDQEQLSRPNLVAFANQHPHHRPRHRGGQALTGRVRPHRTHPVHVGRRRFDEPVALSREGDEHVAAVQGEAGHGGFPVYEGAQPPVLDGECLDDGLTVIEPDPQAARTFNFDLVLPLTGAVAKPYRPQVAPGS